MEQLFSKYNCFKVPITSDFLWCVNHIYIFTKSVGFIHQPTQLPCIPSNLSAHTTYVQ
jgi:hypothetical protein